MITINDDRWVEPIKMLRCMNIREWRDEKPNG